MAKRKTNKKKWKDFEITRVRLNPEQAVLSCCSGAGSKGMRGIVSRMQCVNGCPASSASGVSS